MKNFIFKSADADLQKMFAILDTIQKNVLYSTHQLDFIRKKIIGLDIDKSLQDEATDYFQQKKIDDQNIESWSKEDLD